jgi:hypothetical protein
MGVKSRVFWSALPKSLCLDRLRSFLSLEHRGILATEYAGLKSKGYWAIPYRGVRWKIEGNRGERESGPSKSSRNDIRGIMKKFV